MSLLFVIFAMHVVAESWESVSKKIQAKYSGYTAEIHDMTMIHKSDMQGMITISTSYIKGEKFRFNSSMQPQTEGSNSAAGMSSMVIYDGKNVWIVSPGTGLKIKVPKKKTEKYKNSENNKWWGGVPENAKLIGSEKINGNDCYIIEYKQDKENRKIWIDKNDLVLVKSETTVKKDTMTVVYSDFKKIKNQWKMAYTIKNYHNDDLISTVTVISLEINKGISDDLFNAKKIKSNVNFGSLINTLNN